MTSETTEHDYASKGVAGTGLGLGIAGTALGLLAGGGTLLGGMGTTKPAYVTKDEYEAGQKIAAKDSEIALLKAENDDEKKMVEVYTELAKQINGVKDIVAANRDRADDRLASAVDKLNGKIDFNKNAQDGVNAMQMSYNAGNTATIACMQNQIAQLQSMTKIVIPNSSVCPGWGTVTVTPSLSAVI